MDPIVPLEASPTLTGDEQNLSRAVELLSQNLFLGSLISAAVAAGYQFLIDPMLQSKAAHNPISKRNPTPNISFSSGRTCESYAESLCHELIHFAIMRAGRIRGLQMTPIADIAMRQCEEAAVLAITSDLMYQAAHGVNMADNNAFPELWKANLASSFYTARAYEAHAGSRSMAVQKAFRRFYTLPDNKFREKYKAYSVNAILAERPEILTNSQNFTQGFNPVSFAGFLPPPYDQILMPCLAAMRPNDPEYLVVNVDLAERIDADFVSRRRAARSTIPDWTVMVTDEGNRHFPWSPRKGSLATQMGRHSSTPAYAVG